MVTRISSERARGDRGRLVLIIVLALVALSVVAFRFVGGYWVDLLWFKSVDRADVFWTELTSRLSLFFIFGVTFTVIAVLNLLIADRLDRKSTRLNSSHVSESRMPSSA